MCVPCECGLLKGYNSQCMSDNILGNHVYNIELIKSNGIIPLTELDGISETKRTNKSP